MSARPTQAPGTAFDAPTARRAASTAKRWSRRIVVVGVMLIGGVSIVAIVSFLLVRAAPSWWPAIAADSQETIAVAEEVEGAVSGVLTRARPMGASSSNASMSSGDWSVSISAADANAWLAVRLRAWVSSRGEELRWPDLIRDVRIASSADGVTIGVRLAGTGGEQIVGVDVMPRIDERGLWLPASTAHAGRLRFPASWGLDQATSTMDAASSVLAGMRGAGDVIGVLEGRIPLTPDPVIELGDGRRVRLVGVTPRDQRVDLTFRTEWSADRE